MGGVVVGREQYIYINVLYFIIHNRSGVVAWQFVFINYLCHIFTATHTIYLIKQLILFEDFCFLFFINCMNNSHVDAVKNNCSEQLKFYFSRNFTRNQRTLHWKVAMNLSFIYYFQYYSFQKTTRLANLKFSATYLMIFMQIWKALFLYITMMPYS